MCTDVRVPDPMGRSEMGEIRDRLMRRGFRAVAMPALMAIAWGSLPAQVIRGTVTERGSGVALAGVVLTAHGDSDRTAGAALTDERGAYELRLPPGRYTLDVKRIGVRRIRLAPFTIDTGETRRQDIALDPIPVMLGSVKVSGRSACVQRPKENTRIAALWEDARAALTATMLSPARTSERDTVVRFQRKLDARTWRVLFEQRTPVASSMDRPFRSLPAEQLSAEGYVQVHPDGSADYFAPDAEVLLSDAFLNDHCFRLVGGAGARLRQVGLAFEPVPHRKRPDVRGVLWLDESTAELRTLEFTFTWLPFDERPVDYGGTVDFVRTVGGRWIVRAWRIRTPEFSYEDWFEAPNGDRVPLPRRSTPHAVRVNEEGGAVPIRSLLSETGTLRGSVTLDSAGKQPLGGVTVVVGGSSTHAVTDRFGHFLLPFVAPGSYTIVLRHPGLDSLGIEHLATTVDVHAGETIEMHLQFPSMRELASRLCGKGDLLRTGSILRFLVVDKETGAPLRGVPVTVTRAVARPDSLVQEDGSLDDGGSYLVCDIPDRTSVRIEAADSARNRWSAVTRLNAGTLGWKLVRAAAGGRRPK